MSKFSKLEPFNLNCPIHILNYLCYIMKSRILPSRALAHNAWDKCAECLPIIPPMKTNMCFTEKPTIYSQLMADGKWNRFVVKSRMLVAYSDSPTTQPSQHTVHSRAFTLSCLAIMRAFFRLTIANTSKPNSIQIIELHVSNKC